MRRHPEHAFTLVEMLVVMTIILVLIALMMPTLRAAREAARGSACASNLRQIGLAVHLYGHDARQEIPPIQFWFCAGPGHPHWEGWRELLAPHLGFGSAGDLHEMHARLNQAYHAGANRPFVCPTVGRGLQRHYGSYARNAGFTVGFVPQSAVAPGGLDLASSHNLQEFAALSATMLVIDFDDRRPTPSLQAAIAMNSTAYRQGIADPHNAATNVLYVDGHVRALAVRGGTDTAFNDAAIGRAFWAKRP